MNKNVRAECRKINFSTCLFIIVTILFLIICSFFAWYGFCCIQKFFTQWSLKSWEKWSVLIGLGGAVLFIQIIAELFEKGRLPDKYNEITKLSHPGLFELIDEVRHKLNVTRDIHVFLTSDASASIFVLPDVQNLVRNPERYLSVGSPLIMNLPRNELLAVLYHEFAHLSQESINVTSRAASTGMFANSFLKERIDYNAKYGPGNMTLTLMVFYYSFLDRLCRYIKKHYEVLSDELEFEADKVATQYVKPDDLCQALVHMVKLAGGNGVPYSIKKRIECMVGDKSLLSRFIPNNTGNETAKIFISLSPRKHFLPWVDFSYPILLNGKDIGEGNFLKGFSIEREAHPDLYTIDIGSYISTVDSNPYTFEADAGYCYHIELDYKYSLLKTKYTIFCDKMKVSNLNNNPHHE